MTISVIIPTYNRADLVGRTLDSVLAQTRPPEEVVVVDDGSTDDTRAVVAARRAASGGSVVYHHQENAGLSAARNVGFTLSSGGAVCMLDSDDLLRPEALARLEAALEADPSAALAYCRSQTIDGNGELTEALWDFEDHAGQVWEFLLAGNFIRSPGAALIRRSSLDAVGSWDVRTHPVEDWDMWVRLARLGPFARVDEPLFQYRVHGTSMSGNLPKMYMASQRLYRAEHRRNRGNPARRRAVVEARRHGTACNADDLLNRAYGDRRRGDFVGAYVKMAAAIRLRPAYLLHASVLRVFAGTCRRMIAARLRRRPGGAPTAPRT